MKIKIGLALALVAGFVANAAEPVIMESYAGVFPATESRLGQLAWYRWVEDTAVASAMYGSFATKLVFPDNVTSVTFTSASFAIESYINNTYTLHTPGGVNMALSQLNPEGDVSTPSIFGRNSAGGLIAPVNTSLVSSPIANVKSFLITEHKAPLPQLVNLGDYWVIYRSISGTYTIDGVQTPFSFANQPAIVVVVNETNAPINGVTMDYPNKPTTTFTQTDTTATITATGVTADSYNKSWWLETSTTMLTNSWTVATNGSVSGVVITFPKNPSETKRFWRIKGLQP